MQMSSAKCQPFCVGLNELPTFLANKYVTIIEGSFTNIEDFRFETLRTVQNGPHFVGNTFKYTFKGENFRIWHEISLRCVKSFNEQMIV